MTAQVLSLYLDHPKVGCGWRRYLVLQAGRKHARLLCIENAEPLKVPVTELARGKAEAFKPQRLKKQIRSVARTYAREDSWAVKDAIKLLHPVRAVQAEQVRA